MCIWWRGKLSPLHKSKEDKWRGIMGKKYIPLVLLVLILLTGCEGSSSLPSYNSDFFYLETDNCYVDLSAEEAVYFRLLSCKPLTKDDVSARLNIPNTYYDLSFSENASTSLAWMEGSKYHSTITQDISKYLNAFEAIDLDKIPVIYQYGLYLEVNYENRPMENFKATELALTVNGKTQKYSLEDLIYSAKPGRSVPPVHPDNLLISNIQAIMQYLTLPSAKGSINLFRLCIEIGEDLTLKRIEFLNHPEIRCANVSVTSTGKDGWPVERAWDGNSPLKLNSGRDVELSITLENPLFAGELSGIFADTMLIIYEHNGAEYSEHITVNYNVATNKYLIYAREQLWY
jgi:hypothetical protein